MTWYDEWLENEAKNWEGEFQNGDLKVYFPVNVSLYYTLCYLIAELYKDDEGWEKGGFNCQFGSYDVQIIFRRK